MAAAQRQALSLGLAWEVVGIEHDWLALAAALDAHGSGYLPVTWPEGFALAGRTVTSRDPNLAFSLFRAAVGPQMSRAVTITPTRRFIPHRLIVHTAASFEVEQLFAGVEPLLPGGPVSAAVFCADAKPIALRRVVMEVGMDLSARVTNISGDERDFWATVVGVAAPR